MTYTKTTLERVEQMAKTISSVPKSEEDLTVIFGTIFQDGIKIGKILRDPDPTPEDKDKKTA